MRSLTGAHHDHDELSSPDPIASSPPSVKNTLSGPKRKSSAAAVYKHNTTRTTLDDGSYLPSSSPSKTVTEQTVSPWKIRVTVEAQPEEYPGNIQTVTRTTKVPLNTSSSPAREKSEKNEKTKKAAPRPRAGSGSGSKGRQRSATPTAERRRRQSVTDLDIVVLGDDADEDEWGRKPTKSSPRKSKASKRTPKQGREATPLSDTASNFEVRPDTEEEDGQVADRDGSVELRQLDLNRVSVRSRANSAKQQDPPANEMRDGSPYENTSRVASRSEYMGRRTASANSTLTYPTPSPTVSERGWSVDIEEKASPRRHVEGFDTIMESEGFTMIDLDSLSSVQKMKDSPLDGQTKPSASQLRSPAESESSVRRYTHLSTTHDDSSRIDSTKEVPPYLVIPEAESEISCTVPSSPPAFEARRQPLTKISPMPHLQPPSHPRNRLVTPQTLQSPQLPSPPRPIVIKDRSTPDSAKAMKAGIALQGAVEPPELAMATRKQSATTAVGLSHHRSNSDELFEGFDAGTKRELRAGLRFGEELAKRQFGDVSSNESGRRPEITYPQIWRGESVMSRTPIQALSNQERATSSKNGPLAARQVPEISTPRLSKQSELKCLDTRARREQEWELERRAVSKQIEDAGPSKVIVIDSDDEDERISSEPGVRDQEMQDVTMGDDDGDIWLEEAREASSSPRQESEEPQVPSQGEPHRQYRPAREVSEKPVRSRVPGPRRRVDAADQDNSTILTNGEDNSGLFWKQAGVQDGVQFGANAINHVRQELRRSGESEFLTRRTSGVFDIGKMLETPQRIKDSLEKDQGQPAGDVGTSSSVQTRDLSTPVEDAVDYRDDNYDDDDYDNHDGFDDDSSHHSYYNDDTLPLSEIDTHTVPVKFNDSTISQAQITPPQSTRSRVAVSPSVARPPTPRSAMKGARQSFGAVQGLGVAFDGPEQSTRKVIFAERSKGVDIDWVESSSSLRSSTEDSNSSPVVEHQKHHHERQLSHQAPTQADELALDSSRAVEVPVREREREQDRDEVPVQGQGQVQNQSGWFDWLRKTPKSLTDNSDDMPAPAQAGSTSESRQMQSQNRQDTNTDTEWNVTSRHSAPRQSTTTSRSTSQEHRRQSQTPSYLSAPSYPSDPTRDPRVALSTSGRFTNTHFRTLHILHRKCLRPRFHGPKFASCRPELRDLVARKWQLEVDESSAGLGGFAWTVGTTEAIVLERFCREVEFGVLCDQQNLPQRDGEHQAGLEESMSEWLGEGGIWSGRVGHGQAAVSWGWDVGQLATWLGRIVVGEVVREEEYGGTARSGS